MIVGGSWGISWLSVRAIILSTRIPIGVCVLGCVGQPCEAEESGAAAREKKSERKDKVRVEVLLVIAKVRFGAKTKSGEN